MTAFLLCFFVLCFLFIFASFGWRPFGGGGGGGERAENMKKIQRRLKKLDVFFFFFTVGCCEGTVLSAKLLRYCCILSTSITNKTITLAIIGPQKLVYTGIRADFVVIFLLASLSPQRQAG